MGLLIQITVHKENQQKDRTWRSKAVEKVLKDLGTQSLRAYIYNWQAIVAKWVRLQPILEVCDMEKGYKGWERFREPWWWQTAARKQLSCTLKDILAAARARC